MKQAVENLHTGDKVDLVDLVDCAGGSVDDDAYDSFDGGYPVPCTVSITYRDDNDVVVYMEGSDYEFRIPKDAEIDIAAISIVAKDLSVYDEIHVTYLFETVAKVNNLGKEETDEMYASFWGGYPQYDYVSSVDVLESCVQFTVSESEYEFTLPLDYPVRVQ